MKIALIGYGKMGQLIDTIATAKGHTIVARVSPNSETKTITSQTIGNADVCIDFSHPDSVINNLQACASLNKNVIIGTTGWTDQLNEAHEIVKKYKIGCMHSANFSIGVNLFMQIVAHAAEIIDAFDEYDVGAFEFHHRHKIDSPSGTAKALTEILQSKSSRKKQCDFASVRCGSIPGTHTVLFDSPADTITLTHEARNREGFAKGAVAAAEWIRDKKGLLTIADFLKG